MSDARSGALGEPQSTSALAVNRPVLRPIHDRAVCELLVREGRLSEAALRDAEEYAATRSLGSVGYALTELAYLTERELADHYAKSVDIDRIDIDRVEIDPSIAKRFPEQMSVRFDLVVVETRGRKCRCVLADPTDLQAIDDLRWVTGYEPEVTVAERSAIRCALAKLYGTSSSRVLAHRAQDQAPFGVRLCEAIFHDMSRVGEATLHLLVSSGSATVRWTAFGATHTEELDASSGREFVEELFRDLQVLEHAPWPDHAVFTQPTLGVECHLHVHPNPGSTTHLLRMSKLYGERVGPLARSPRGERLAAVDFAYERMHEAIEAWKAKDFDRAASECRRALELSDEPFLLTDPDFQGLRSVLGVVTFLRGDYEEALAEQTLALERHTALLGQADLASARYAIRAGLALLALGQDERARALITRSTQIYEALVAPDDAGLKLPLIDAGLCAWAGGNLEEARALFLRARAIPPAPTGAGDEVHRRTLRLLAALDRGDPAPRGIAMFMRDDA